jgi:hypothetical protein
MIKAGTVAGDVHAMQSALVDITPPLHVTLRKKDMPFWQAIVRARARDTWTDIDLTHAANLARTQADIEQVQRDLDLEGFTLVNDRGTTVQNPKFSILETLSRRAVLLSKSLQVHAHATVGESREQAVRNKSESEARRVIQSEDDDLIARPGRYN